MARYYKIIYGFFYFIFLNLVFAFIHFWLQSLKSIFLHFHSHLVVFFALFVHLRYEKHNIIIVVDNQEFILLRETHHLVRYNLNFFLFVLSLLCHADTKIQQIKSTICWKVLCLHWIKLVENRHKRRKKNTDVYYYYYYYCSINFSPNVCTFHCNVHLNAASQRDERKKKQPQKSHE